MLGVVGAIWVHQLAIDAGFSGAAAMTIALAGFAPPVAISLVGGVIAARRITNAKKGAWLDALAAEHGLPPERLREVAEIFD